MKIKVKVNSSRSVVTLEDNSSVGDLKRCILNMFMEGSMSQEETALSLNGNDPLSENDSATLASLGIVNGDLVHVLFGRELPTSALLRDTTQPKIAKLDSESLKTSKKTSGTEREEVVTPSREKDVEVPVFLHEGITPFLAELYDGTNPQTLHDAFFLVLMTLLFEGGLKAQVLENAKQPEEPSFWNLWKKEGGVYKVPLILPGCSPGVATFAAISVGPYLPVNVHVSVKETKLFRTTFRVDRYVRGDIPLQKGPHELYQNLRELSRIFKDRIVLPLLKEFRNGLDIPILSNSLLGIPAEIKCRILALLDVKSLLRTSQTCKELYFVGNDNELWRRLCLRDFGKSVESENSKAWKEIYIMKYRQVLEDRRRREQRLRGFLPTNPFAQTQPYSQMWPFRTSYLIPGIRGGIYDLIPVYRSFPSLHERQDMEEDMRSRFDPVYPTGESSRLRTRFGNWTSH